MTALLLIFVLALGAFAVLVGFGFYRIALHLRGNKEATRALVEHLFIPLFTGPKKSEFPDIEEYEFVGVVDDDKP